MALITGNTNEFVVYLTDKGKETFFNGNNKGGLQDQAYYFSLSDADANYGVLADPSFDPHKPDHKVLTITNTNKTTNGFTEVFTQMAGRGDINDNKSHNHGLLGVNVGTQRDYVLFNPNYDQTLTLASVNYKKIGDYRQFNLSNLDGIYLRSPYTPITVSLGDLIQDYDFYPIDNVDVNRFTFINAKLQPAGANVDLSFVGSNAKTTATNNLIYSQIIKKNELVQLENYHVYFDFYFRFIGAQNLVYNPTGTSENLNINLYVLLGANKIKMNLSNLQQFRTTGTTYQFTNDVIFRQLNGGSGASTRTNLVSLVNSNTQINLNYSEKQYTYTGFSTSHPVTIRDNFDGTMSPNGYNFRVKASLDLSKFYQTNRCLNSKDFSILVQYSRLANKFIKNKYITTTYFY